MSRSQCNAAEAAPAKIVLTEIVSGSPSNLQTLRNAVGTTLKWHVE